MYRKRLGHAAGRGAGTALGQRVGRSWSRREVLAASAAFAALAAGLPAAARSGGSRWHDEKKYADVFGQRMAYHESGSGRPIVFLHGNPTSSYLWRNVVPHVEKYGRCIAPDLVGMGDSAKLPNSGPGVYTLDAHRRYLYGLLNQLGADRDVVLVVHDWGSVFGFDFAAHHGDTVRGIAYMESFMWWPQAQWHGGGKSPFGFKNDFKSSRGEQLVLQENAYIKHIIAAMRDSLTSEDIAEYERPFAKRGESRRPILAFTKELSPTASRETFEVIRAYCAWLAHSNQVPKLFIHAKPGAIMALPRALNFALSLPNQQVVEVSGRHFIQETSPDKIGQAIAAWVATLPDR